MQVRHRNTDWNDIYCNNFMQKCVFICTHIVGSMYSCSFSSFSSAGNLYSREVQVNGEQVAVQVQDTPGVLVSPSRRLIHVL